MTRRGDARPENRMQESEQHGDQSLERLGQLLGETARAWRHALDRRLRPMGLSGARWLVLLHLARAPEPLTQKALAHRVGIEGPTLVGLLDRMAADGWVERRPSGSDRRSKNIHLTARARRTIPQIEETAATLRRELLSGLSDRDLQICMKVLTRIRQGAEQAE